MPIVQTAQGFENVAHVIQVDPSSRGYQAPVGAQAFSVLTKTLYVKIGDQPVDWCAVAPVFVSSFSEWAPIGTVVTDEIDFTVPGVYTLVPAIPFTLTGPATSILITARDGSITTSPVLKFGTNSTNDNYCAQQTGAAGFGTTNAGFRLGSAATSVSPIPVLDMTATGFRMEIVTGAVLNTATQLKGRYANIITMYRSV